MPNIKLYTLNESAPCRIVQMTLGVLNLEYEAITVDLFNGEHKTPEYVEVFVIVRLNEKPLMLITIG